MEDSIGVAPVHLVHTECVPGQCGVVLRGLLQGAKDGESLYFQLLSSELQLDDSLVSPKDGYVFETVLASGKVVQTDQDVFLGNVCQVVEKEGS